MNGKQSIVLQPSVFFVFPRHTDAIRKTVRSILPRFPCALSIGLASSESESNLFKQDWSDVDAPLLLIRATLDNQMVEACAAILDISNQRPAQPIAILLIDGPEVSGFATSKPPNWNEEFAKTLAKSIKDLQVIEYSETWQTSPPRIR